MIKQAKKLYKSSFYKKNIQIVDKSEIEEDIDIDDNEKTYNKEVIFFLGSLFNIKIFFLN